MVITSAQNKTAILKKGLKSLEVFCELNGAELIVLPFMGKDKEAEWHPFLSEYLQDNEVTQDFSICNNLDVVTSMPINYQNADPVAGIENITKDRSCIVPGTKLRVKVVPVKQNRLPKMLICPGAITKPNYRKNRAGYIAETKHTLSAIYLETDGVGTFHHRQLTIHPVGGYFYDLDKKYTHRGVSMSNCLALVLGDVHVPNNDLDVYKSTFLGDKSLYSVTKPKDIIVHDLLDFESASHHDKGSASSYFKETTNKHNVENELNKVVSFLDSMPAKTFVVSSNHNDHITKWLEGPIPTGINLKIWHKLNFDRLDCGGLASPLALFVEEKQSFLNDVDFLNDKDSLIIGGYELAMHGHKGANGAKGSLKSFCTAGVPTVTGHSHTPQVMDGSIVVGTNSLLDMGYNVGGLSSWIHSSCLIYPYGATLINFINGKWRF
jgi:hypothetical protein